jgi:hypothetical protein
MLVGWKGKDCVLESVEALAAEGIGAERWVVNKA